MQLGECLHPQGEQQTLTQPSGHLGLEDLREPGREHHGERHRGRKDQYCSRGPRYARVHPVAHQGRQGETRPRVHHHEQQTQREQRVHSAQQMTQRERRITDGGVRRAHPDRLGGRWQRRDARKQLRGRGKVPGRTPNTASPAVGGPGRRPRTGRSGPHATTSPRRRGREGHGGGCLPGRGCGHRRPANLAVHQHRVERATSGQFLVGADVDQAPGVEHRDAISQLQSGSTVGDQQRRPATHDLSQRGMDLGLDPDVNRGRRVVQDQDGRVGQQGASQRDPLTLPAGEGEPLLTDDRVVAVREIADEAVRPGCPGRGHNRGVSRVRTSVADVGTNRVGEQKTVLEHHRELRPQR